MNQVILFGRLGKTPELRTFQNGGQVANATLATDESYKDKDGKKVEQAEWHNLVFRNKTSQAAEKYLTKGSQILVRGKLKTRHWETQLGSGDKRYATEVIVDSFEFGAPANERNDNSKPSPAVTPPAQEDDLPF